jgi:hypothetical protein
MTEVLVTMEALRAAGACYCEEGREGELLALYPERTEVPLAEALRDERLPLGDRVWLCAYMLPAGPLERWAERVVTRTVTRYALPHPATAAWAAEQRAQIADALSVLEDTP